MSDFSKFAGIKLERQMKLNPIPSATASDAGYVWLPGELCRRLFDLAEREETTVQALIALLVVNFEGEVEDE